MSDLPLSNVRVLDLTRAWAGPHGVELLGHLGADIVKVEPPWVEGFVPGGSAVSKRPPSFFQLHINKRTVSLDLTSVGGRSLLLELLKLSDVVVENYSAHVMDRLGLGYDALCQVKPDIIMCSLPAFGKTGPWADYVCYGVCLEPLAGMFSLTGYEGTNEPQRSGVDHLDPVTGTHAASAIMSALLYRQQTGEGQFIDMSHLESAVMIIGENVLEYTLTGNVPRAMGNRSRRMAPHGVYPCSGDDRWVAIAVQSDEEWARLSELMGAPELATGPRFSTTAARLSNQDELDALVAKWTAGQDRYGVMHALQDHGIAAGVVQDMADLDNDPHLKARDFFQEYDDLGLGVHKHFTAPWRMSDAPHHIRKPADWHFAPDTDEVFGQLLGLSRERLSSLQEAGVVITAPKRQSARRGPRPG